MLHSELPVTRLWLLTSKASSVDIPHIKPPLLLSELLSPFLSAWLWSPFFLSLFIYLRRESTSRGGQRESGRERIPSRFHTVSADPDVGLSPTNWEIMTWAEIKSGMRKQLSYPGTLVPAFKFECCEEVRKGKALLHSRGRGVVIDEVFSNPCTWQISGYFPPGSSF